MYVCVYANLYICLQSFTLKCKKQAGDLTFPSSAHGPTDLMEVDLPSCRCNKMMCAWGTIDFYAADVLHGCEMGV